MATAQGRKTIKPLFCNRTNCALQLFRRTTSIFIMAIDNQNWTEKTMPDSDEKKATIKKKIFFSQLVKHHLLCLASGMNQTKRVLVLLLSSITTVFDFISFDSFFFLLLYSQIVFLFRFPQH